MLVIAHLSDVHVDGGERSAERTERVVRYLAGLPTPVDVVLVTGDIADHGAEAEYKQARDLIDLSVPTLFCPGNHDRREPYREVLLGEAPEAGPINSAHRVGGALFAMCDSSVPGRNDGLLADETVDWLDEQLSAAPDLPAFVCFHHPPVVLGIPYVDGIRQFSEERLAAVVARHPNVVALLCGHAHTPAASTFAGRPLLVAPGVVSTIRLPFETDTIADLTLPPMLALHILHPDGRLTTHYRVVP
ncbi:MAG: phosphodiesterase [Micromonosporaceae bacterium]|jgi:3',5'-cyclic AMP phosphodiesterase CpdA|nr:phosphodiesterase [Micromonosporaceae bacterium]